MKNITYKGFKVESATKKLADKDEWTLEVTIANLNSKSGAVLERNYSGNNTFKSLVEADSHCISYGKQIIDEKYPDQSVEDLL